MPHPALPLVSVVIPFYNCPFVSQSIGSVLAQTYPHVEIIVVDDGSTLHQEKLDPYSGRIRYFRKPNGGTASALNRGIRLAYGEYIVWLSSDDLMCADKITVQLAYMQQHRALICCTDFHLIDRNNEILIPNLAAKFPSARLFIEALLRFCPVNGSTVMIHRTLPEVVGWFDESLACTQDYDYWIRVHLARVDFHYLDQTLTLYRWHEGMGTQRMKERADQEFLRVRDHYLHRLHALIHLL